MLSYDVTTLFLVAPLHWTSGEILPHFLVRELSVQAVSLGYRVAKILAQQICGYKVKWENNDLFTFQKSISDQRLLDIQIEEEDILYHHHR